MATTTNYGWTTPDDTALVKDGAAAIRTLGSSVDTTTKALNPETTLGDIVYRSSTANVKTRLGIGTSGQVLSVSGGVPAWTTPASGWSPNLTLLSTTSIDSGVTSVQVNVTAYDYYVLLWKNVSANSGAMFSLKINASGTAANYKAQLQIEAKAVGATNPDYTNTGAQRYTGNGGFVYIAKKGNSNSSTNYIDGVINVIGGKNTGAKSIWWTTNPSASNNATAFGSNGSGVFDNGSAISSFTIESSDGNFNAGTVEIYGG
jgi:hypothetical protein